MTNTYPQAAAADDAGDFGARDLGAGDLGAGDTRAEAALPPVTYTVSDDVVVLSDPSGVQAESISALRTHLNVKHTQEGRRALTVCASDPDEGAAWLATNLAVSLAQSNVRTLLIDCNLRAPEVHQLIRPSRDVPGLRDLLENDTLSIGAAIQADVLPELAVMYAGGETPHAQELLFGSRFAQTIDLCLRDFDATIAVPPPFKFYADARHVSTLLRYAIVVARKDTSLIANVQTMIHELEMDGVRVVGSVYNG